MYNYVEYNGISVIFLWLNRQLPDIVLLYEKIELEVDYEGH